MKLYCIIALSLLLRPETATAQQEESITLSLQQAIEIAQENSPEAQAARHTYRAAYWNYRFFRANYLPSVTLTSSPTLNREINKITQPDGTNQFIQQDQLSTDLSLKINQNIWFTGGSLFVKSTTQRIDEFEDNHTAYNTQPIVIGYEQQLFGYNSLKWDHRIEPLRYREARKAYAEALELVASETSTLFFNLATAQTNLDIAAYNYASADTLYRYAEGRYNIGTITENEMLQLEINKLTEETNMMNARIEVEDQMQTLRSFLGINREINLRVIPEDSIPQLEIPLQKALQLAFKNSPDPDTYKRKQLESRSALASAKANAGLKADLYVQFGLSQTGNKFADSYRNPMNQQYASIGISLPILDWGRGKGRVRVARSNVDLVDTIAEVKNDKFMEYVDVEGLVQPILTIKVNTREAGSVDRIVGEEGNMMKQGDTLLILTNPDLIRSIEDQRDEWEKQRITYKEKEIEMEQKSLTLKQQTLQAQYEMERLRKSFGLDKEEFKMGIKSKAELQVSEDEYKYKLKNTALQMESLKHDSSVTLIRKELLKNDLERESKKLKRAEERLEDLIIKAPIGGQLSFVKVTPGQQVASGESIAEIKVLDQYKIHTSLSEYYIDRITTGLPATVNYQGKRYPLRITKVVPEVKDRMFDVDLVFTGEMPENVRVGKSFRVQIELGQPEQAIVIPRGNFYQSTGGQWIYKINPSKTKAVKVPLNIGRQNPLQYEITEGLQPGEFVIITGYDTFGDAEELILK